MEYLNNYAGLGGNIDLLDDIKNKITNIELEPSIASILEKRKPNQKTIIADAHQYLLDNHQKYDFVWSSPPCQTHSRMMKATRHKQKRYSDMSLYQEILFLTHFFKGKWVVENVKPYYEPLIKPTFILGRHYFWSNFEITKIEVNKFPNFITDDTIAGTERLKKWLGIEYDGNIYYKGNHSPGQVLRNCVHPKIGLHIFNCANNSNKNKSKNTEQTKLF